MRRWEVLGAVVVTACLPSAAAAHVLSAEAKTAGDKLEVAARFNEKLPADDAKVEVRGPGGVLVAEGVTNGEGVWVGKLPPPGVYTLTVSAFGDHTCDVELVVRPDSTTQPPRPGDGWQWKAAAVGGLLAAWLAAVWWLRRRRLRGSSATGQPDSRAAGPDAASL